MNLASNNLSDNEAIIDDDESDGDHATRPSTSSGGADHDGETYHGDDGTSNTSAKKSNRLYEDAYVTLSFEPNYILRFDIQSSIGRAAAVTSRLMNVDKIAQLVEYRLKRVFEERFVYPNHRKFYLPSVLPKKKPSPPEGSNSSMGGKPGSQPTAGLQQQQQQQQQQGQQQQGLHGFIIDDHLSSPRLHPRSFSSVSQLASNTALNMPVPPLPLRNQQLVQDDESAII